MRSSSPSKYFYITLSILTLCAYSFFVYAAAPVGGYVPGETLDPIDCSPGDTDCLVRQAWEIDTASDYVYNTTESIGIGTATPGSPLSVASSTLAAGSLVNLAVMGTAALSSTQKALNITTSGANANASQRTYGAFISNTHTGTSSTNVGLYATASGGTSNYAALFPAGSVGIGTQNPTSALDVVGEIAGAASVSMAGSTTAYVNDFTTTLSASANTTLTSYTGTRSLLTWNGGAFNTTTAVGTTGITGLLGGVEIPVSASGTIANVVGTASYALNVGTGTIDDLKGSISSALNTGSGTLANAFAGTNSMSNTGIGVIGDGYGITGRVTNSGAGSMVAGYGGDFKVVASDGSITVAKVLNLNAYMSGSGTIATATGINMGAGLQGVGYQSGVEATGTATGINFSGANDGITDFAAIDGADVYGIYFGDKSLDGSSSEYALFIEDNEAQNYLLNGVRIGGNGDANKFDNATNGGSSTQMYIGNSTIDVTAPSDERTKTDIEPTSFGLADLNAIEIVDFTYDQEIIDDNDERHSGVLAQQVKSIYPEAVTRRTDGYFMVDYKTFIPLIMKSVQDLDLKIADIDTQAAVITMDETFYEGIRKWFADIGNGITKLFAGEIETKKLCVADDAGEKTCITKSQLDEILAGDEVEVVEEEEEVAEEVVEESEVEAIEDVEEVSELETEETGSDEVEGEV